MIHTLLDVHVLTEKFNNFLVVQFYPVLVTESANNSDEPLYNFSI